jgi:hypothetical protein
MSMGLAPCAVLIRAFRAGIYHELAHLLRITNEYIIGKTSKKEPFMNLQRPIAVLALAALFASFGAMADSASSQPVANSGENYEYGMPLDVAKVVSITPASNVADCQVGTAHMVYVDHQGQTREVNYREMGNCSQL